jgi:hypothetical protein
MFRPKPLERLGGRTRTRTWDPLIKSQLLYQLSYAPRTRVRSCSKAIPASPGRGNLHPKAQRHGHLCRRILVQPASQAFSREPGFPLPLPHARHTHGIACHLISAPAANRSHEAGHGAITPIRSPATASGAGKASSAASAARHAVTPPSGPTLPTTSAAKTATISAPGASPTAGLRRTHLRSPAILTDAARRAMPQDALPEFQLRTAHDTPRRPPLIPLALQLVTTKRDSRRTVWPGGSHASAIVSGGWEYDRRASL